MPAESLLYSSRGVDASESGSYFTKKEKKKKERKKRKEKKERGKEKRGKERGRKRRCRAGQGSEEREARTREDAREDQAS